MSTGTTDWGGRVDAAPGLEVEHLVAGYGPVRVLHGNDLIVPAGKVLAVVGASGSGKTTLLRCIAGFENPEAGRIRIDGRVVSAAGRPSVPAHLRDVGYVAQDGALFPHLDVAANVLFGLPRHRRSRARAVELLASVDLDPLIATRRPDQLSGGQQQRVSLARAMARRPKVMLLDEPFSALDTNLRERTRAVIGHALHDAGITTVLVTHDRDEALSFADLVAVMSAGRISQVGPPEQVYSRPRDLVTARMLGDTVELPAQIRGGTATGGFGALETPRAADGPALLVLRPEQIVVHREAGAPDRVSDQWRIVSATYHGDHQRLQLQAEQSPGARSDGDRQMIAVRAPAAAGLHVGDLVTISAIGPALVLPASAAQASVPPATGRSQSVNA